MDAASAAMAHIARWPGPMQAGNARFPHGKQVIVGEASNRNARHAHQLSL